MSNVWTLALVLSTCLACTESPTTSPVLPDQDADAAMADMGVSETGRHGGELDGAVPPTVDTGMVSDAEWDGASDTGMDSGRTPSDAGGMISRGISVETTEGIVEGLYDRRTGVRRWLGIPFAAPPVGALRWRAPHPVSPWEGPRQAVLPGPACPQTGNSAGGLPVSEDCLYLNVWSPANARGLPVMFWIHGGAFTTGSGGMTLYDGAKLAEQNVVVVSINYRLNILGFFSHPGLFDDDPMYPGAGNYGLLDQIAALEWVQENVGVFGGNPEQVTIFGESAGGVSVCALLSSPLTTGLFARAIMMSGFCMAQMEHFRRDLDGRPPAARRGERLAILTGCAITPDPLACLRALPLAQIAAGAAGLGVEYEPMIDDHVLPQTPAEALAQGDTPNIPLMVGTTGDEGTVFAAPVASWGALETLIRAEIPIGYAPIVAEYSQAHYESPFRAMAALVGDAVFVCPARWAAQESAAQGHPTWLYHFTHETAYGEVNNLGAFHGSELGYLFESYPLLGFPLLGAELEMARGMQDWWTSFAQRGRPESERGGWPRYTVETDQAVEINTNSQLVSGWRS